MSFLFFSNLSRKFCRLIVLLIQFFPVALSVIFLLVCAKCNFASVFEIYEEAFHMIRAGNVFLFEKCVFRWSLRAYTGAKTLCEYYYKMIRVECHFITS